MRRKPSSQKITEKWEIEDPVTGKMSAHHIPKISVGDPLPDPRHSESHVIASTDVKYLTSTTFIEGMQNGCHPWIEDNRVIWTCQTLPAWLDPAKSKYNNSILRAQGEEFTVKSDTNFSGVLDGCCDRKHTWITKKMRSIYLDLHNLGIAHSIEVYMGTRLAGGLFFLYNMGICLAESMFHYVENASKVALTRLIWQMGRLKCHFIDSRKFRDKTSHHLLRYGFEVSSRENYLDTLHDSLILSPRPWIFDEDLETSFTVSEAKLMYQTISQ